MNISRLCWRKMLWSMGWGWFWGNQASIWIWFCPLWSNRGRRKMGSMRGGRLDWRCLWSWWYTGWWWGWHRFEGSRQLLFGWWESFKARSMSMLFCMDIVIWSYRAYGFLSGWSWFFLSRRRFWRWRCWGGWCWFGTDILDTVRNISCRGRSAIFIK